MFKRTRFGSSTTRARTERVALALGFAESRAKTENENTPVTEGALAITSFASLSENGEWRVLMEYVYGASPPMACSVAIVLLS